MKKASKKKKEKKNRKEKIRNKKKKTTKTRRITKIKSLKLEFYDFINYCLIEKISQFIIMKLILVIL